MRYKVCGSSLTCLAISSDRFLLLQLSEVLDNWSYLNKTVLKSLITVSLDNNELSCYYNI